MKRAFSSISLGDGKAKAKVTLTADPVEPGSSDQHRQLYELLTLLGQQPDMSQCQGHDFEEMRMYWNGASWILDFSAVVPERKR